MSYMTRLIYIFTGLILIPVITGILKWCLLSDDTTLRPLDKVEESSIHLELYVNNKPYFFRKEKH